MIEVHIPKQVKRYVASKQKYSDVVSGKLGIYGDGFRKHVFAIKSFLTDCNDKNDYLYIPLNYGKVISSAFKDYVIGKGFDVEGIEDERIADVVTKTGLLSKLTTVSEKASSMGYGILRVIRVNDKIVVEQIPVKNYFPNTATIPLGGSIDDCKEHTIVTIQDDLNGSIRIGQIAYVSHYKLQDNGKRLYQFSKHRIGLNESHKDHDWNFNIQNRTSDEEIIETLDELPLFIFNNDVNDDESDYTSDKGYQSDAFLGDSDLVSSMEIMAELSDRFSQVSVEYIKHLSSKMSFPRSFLEDLTKRNKIKKDRTQTDLQSFEFYSHGAGESLPQYIQKNNDHMNNVIEFMKFTVSQLAVVSGVPLALMGVDDGTAQQAVGVRNKKFERFYQRVTSKRNTIKPVIERLYNYIGGLLGLNIQSTVTFKSLEDNDTTQEIANVVEMKLNGLLSQFTGIKRLNPDRTDEMILEEINRINSEANIASALSGTFNPLPTLSLN